MDKRQVVIKVDELGRGRVEIDGHDLSDAVSGFRLEARAGDLTRLVLELTTAVDVSAVAAFLELEAPASASSEADALAEAAGLPRTAIHSLAPMESVGTIYRLPRGGGFGLEVVCSRCDHPAQTFEREDFTEREAAHVEVYSYADQVPRVWPKQAVAGALLRLAARGWSAAPTGMPQCPACTERARDLEDA